VAGITAVFFDLGDTLGTATVGGQPPRLTGFDVFPFVPGVLADLKARGLKLGVISNTGGEKAPAVNAVLAPTGLLARLDNALLVFSGDEGVTKASPEIFKRAAARAGVPAAQCLFVGEDAAERMVAMSAGWAVCPHPLLVGEVLDGQSVRYVRLTVPAAHAAAPCRNT
jgi:bacterial leucyl aminopeptidase